MAAPVNEVSWVAHPDIITAAIRLLTGAVLTLGASLVGVLLYIWHQTKGKIDSVDGKVDKIVEALHTLANRVTSDIKEINTRCDERHNFHRRATDQ